MKKKNILSLTRVFKFAIIFIIICSFSITTQKEENKIAYEESTYYEGKYNNINHVANLLDSIKKEDILISPFNMNSSLAALYNVDNNLVNYFKDSTDSVNDYYLSKMTKYKLEKKEKNKKEEYYKKLIKEFYNNNYDKITYQSLNKTGTHDKEKIIKDINKIMMIEESFNNKSITIKQIEKYKLSKNALNQSNQTIINNINRIIWNYNLFTKKNYLINISNLYYSGDKKIKLDDLKVKYLINSYNNPLSSLEDIKKINDDILSETNKNTNYIVDTKDIGSSSLLVGSFAFNYKWNDLIDINKNTYEDYYIGEEIKSVEMLNFTSENYIENNVAQGFIKDYEDGKYSFIGILPKHNEKLSFINIEELINNKREVNINISIPKFSITDFNNVYDKKIELDENIVLDKYYQKNSFSFSEAGTYNLEVPLLENNNIAVLSSVENITFNHPFYFLILDNDNNSVLLAGKITNPSF